MLDNRQVEKETKAVTSRRRTRRRRVVSRRPSAFSKALAEREAGRADQRRTWVFVPYDQLNDGMGLLAERDPAELGVLLVENPASPGSATTSG